MIQITSLTKRFGRTPAVDAVSLEIPTGDSVALWGPNGAGKSTLIRCVVGLLRFKGFIRVAGQDVRARGKQARMHIGYVPQEIGFYDDLRVSEAVRLFGRLKGLLTRPGDDALESVGLQGHGRKRIRELSGGMKQRLALAIAMLGDPPVLILDEVTASLDACGRDDFVSLLSRLSGEGRTMLFASHRVEEVAALARRVVCMERGGVTSITPAAEFASRLGADAVLHLALPSTLRDRAAACLRAGGFEPVLNGVGLLVPVAAEHKAAPFRVLAEERIAIDDFELLSPGAAAAARIQREEHP